MSEEQCGVEEHNLHIFTEISKIWWDTGSIIYNDNFRGLFSDSFNSTCSLLEYYSL